MLMIVTGCTSTITNDIEQTQEKKTQTEDMVPYFKAILPSALQGFGKMAKHIVFFSNRSGTYELYQVDLDGTNLVQISQDGAYDMEPAWSLDGKKIAFASTHVNGAWEVFVLNLEEGSLTQLTNFEANTWSLAWSPDSKSLAFVSDFTGDDEIYLAKLGDDAQASSVEISYDFAEVTPPVEEEPIKKEEEPVLTPEQKEKLKYWIDHTHLPGPKLDEGKSTPSVGPEERTKSDIGKERVGLTEPLVLNNVVPSRPGAPINLTQAPYASDGLPVWSPDGQHIAFVSDREGDEDIFLMAPDGLTVTRLTRSEGRDTSPNWSPDGSRIVFVSERDGNFEIYLMNADGSNPVRLTNNGSYEWSPTWSPDGKLLAFTSTRDHYTTYNIYIMEPDGSNLKQLTFDTANDIIPRWWP